MLNNKSFVNSSIDNHNMRKINIYISILFFTISFLTFSSCGKGQDTPVDKLCAIMNEAADKVETISSASDLIYMKEVITPQAAQTILNENADYQLTKKDKEKLKKSYDRLLKTAYEKTAEYGGFPEAIKKQTKVQIDGIIEAANKGIENAKTLGDINGLN